MAKIRIYELAKETGADSAKIIDFLGGDLKPASGIEESDAARVRAEFAAPVKKEEKKVSKEVSEHSENKEAEKKAAPVNKPEKEKAPAASEGQPKKKKPVLLFRPENSSFGKKFMNTSGSGSKSQQGRERKTGTEGSAAAGNRRAPQGQQRDNRGGERRVIRPNVPTTAEQYRDYAREMPTQKKDAPVPKKRPEETVRGEEVPAVKEQNLNPVQAENVPVQETREPAPSVKPVNPENTAPEKKPAAVQEEKLQTPEVKAEAPAEKAQDSSAAAAEKETAKAPVKKPEAQEKAAAPAQEKPTARSIFDRNMGPLRNVYKEREEKEARARELRAQNAEKHGESRDRSGEGRRQQGGAQRGIFGSQNQQRTGERRNGDRPGFRQGGAQRPQGQGQGRPGDRTAQGQNRSFGNRPAQGQGQGSRFSRDSRPAAPDTAAIGKNDSRKKNNTNGKALDRQRSDRDRTGKKAENFKNLSKTSQRNQKPQAPRKEEEVIKMITLPDVITLKELAEKMKMKPADIIKKLFLQGKMLTVNSELSYEEAEEVALEYNILCEHEVQVDVIEELLKEEEEDESLMVKRPPVVCVMGHVDHGKTSLLDAIRKTNVTAREAGGITQHIGAYMVELNGEKITFLDTPGHEAFTAMRMRGAQATDVAILVVAADDGVMPQTIEAINHAKAAGVEVIVAVNKIDKPAANIDRVKQELAEYQLIPEDWGGSTIFVPVSAKTGENIDGLLEMILLQTEVMELKANPNREMRGIVIEAKLDKGRGPVATVLVQKGTMKVGDFVSAGSFYGRVRAMLDADGNAMKSATPSTPVEILGLNGVPNAGEVCIGHKNERDARSYAETFIAEEKKKMLAETRQKLSIDTLFDQIQAGNIKELPLIVKADVQGSVEAVRQSLEKLSNEEVQVKVIHGGVGLINESDVSLASASNAIVIGFNVRPDNQAKILADQEHVDLRLYKVIYQAIEDVESAMKGMLAPVYEEKVLGHAEVRMTFKASGVGTIAGSYVLNGTLERGCSARVTRDGVQIFEGPLASLKRFKDDVKEVREGFECGIVFEKFNDIQEGDQIEAYKMVQVERT